MVERRRSQRLRAACARTFARCASHPFVRGVADGSLPPETFARWVVQDGLYLLTYVEALEALAASAPTAAARTRWGQLATLSRDEELDLHRAYAARFGLGPAQLDVTPWPATAAYTSFLQACAARGYGPGVAAVVPCGVDYVSIAARLATERVSRDRRYDDWITMYADPAFAEAVAFMEAELDAACDPDDALAAVYAEGAARELAFWDQLMG